MITTTSVDPSTSTNAELRELYLVRQENDNDDAGCPFRWRVDSMRLGHILRRLPRVPERVRRYDFLRCLGHIDVMSHAYAQAIFVCERKFGTPSSLLSHNMQHAQGRIFAYRGPVFLHLGRETHRKCPALLIIIPTTRNPY
jgi:hypothetical protein